MSKESILLAASILFALALAEIFLAEFFPQRTVNQYRTDRPAMFRADEVLYTAQLPGFKGHLREDEFDTEISINSLGYRQAEFEIEKGDKTRIIVIGDSFTFGYGVEEHDGYVRVLERRLNRDSQTEFQTINAGVTGYWPDAYYLYLKVHGFALKPDIVVVGMFIGNDIDVRDARHMAWPAVDAEGLPLATESRRARVENGHLERTQPRARWTIPVLRNSHLFQLIYTSGKHFVQMFRPEEVPYYMYEHNYSAITLENTKKVEKLFAAMASQSKAAGAKFMVVMIPERLQVYPKYRPKRPLDYDKPQRLFREFFEREGIAYLDLLPIMRNVAQSSQNPIYYERDSHFTRYGYEITGNAIAEFLHDSGLVDQP